MIQVIATVIRYAGMLLSAGVLLGAVRDALKAPSTLTPDIWARFRPTLRPLRVATAAGTGLAGIGIFALCLALPWSDVPPYLPVILEQILGLSGLACAGLGAVCIFVSDRLMKRYLRRVLTLEEYEGLFA